MKNKSVRIVINISLIVAIILGTFLLTYRISMGKIRLQIPRKHEK